MGSTSFLHLCSALANPQDSGFGRGAFVMSAASQVNQMADTDSSPHLGWQAGLAGC